MKPLPAPNVPGETEAARFDYAVRKMFSVSKEAFLEEEAKHKRAGAQGAGEEGAEVNHSIGIPQILAALALSVVLFGGHVKSQFRANPVRTLRIVGVQLLIIVAGLIVRSQHL